MICQDCAKIEGRNLVFDSEKLIFLILCNDCVKETDYICDEELINEYYEDWS